MIEAAGRTWYNSRKAVMIRFVQGTKARKSKTAETGCLPGISLRTEKILTWMQ
jgi:hypothetical protein